MAELLKLDAHCAVTTCGQLDFLPVPCQHCSLRFCAAHASTDGHLCAQAPSNTVSEEEARRMRNKDVYRCAYADCKKAELAPVTCSACEMQLCLQHRHQRDHDCSKYEAPKEANAKTKEVVQNIMKNAPVAKPRLLR